MSIPTQQHIINGEFVPPSSGQYIDLIDPVSGQVAGKAAAGNAADVDAAVAAYVTGLFGGRIQHCRYRLLAMDSRSALD